MNKTTDIGSPAWVEHVFKSADAREVWGLSRPTQRYGIGNENGRPIYAEGGNEACARALMILGTTTGQVLRWKFQPFSLEEKLHGVRATPDLMFETADRKIYVAEPRSSRYLTSKKLEATRAVERVLNETGRLKYLFWTDAWPLSPPTTRLMHELRRCGTSAVPTRAIEALGDLLQQGPKTFFELRTSGFVRDIVMSAVWRGKAHIDLFKTVVDSTVVNANPAQRQFERTLIAPVRAQSIWQEMQSVAATPRVLKSA